MSNRITIFIVLLAFMATFASCGQEEKPSLKTSKNTSAKNAEQPKSTIKNDSKKEIQKDKSQQDQAQKEYSYDPTGKPDPFEPLVAAIAPTKQSAPEHQKSDRPLTPLQKLDLSDLFLVAIVDTDNSSTALIEDSVRNGYIVKEGMLIGRNDGIIKKILKNSMIVEEKITDSTGNVETKLSTLTIYKKE